MLILKLVLLVLYSIAKIIFMMIKVTFAYKIDIEDWKCPFCDSPQTKALTIYHNILLGGSFKCKNLLNFNCTMDKFHNCHHTSEEPLGSHIILKLAIPQEKGIAKKKNETNPKLPVSQKSTQFLLDLSDIQTILPTNKINILTKFRYDRTQKCGFFRAEHEKKISILSMECK